MACNSNYPSNLGQRHAAAVFWQLLHVQRNKHYEEELSHLRKSEKKLITYTTALKIVIATDSLTKAADLVDLKLINVCRKIASSTLSKWDQNKMFFLMCWLQQLLSVTNFCIL